MRYVLFFSGISLAEAVLAWQLPALFAVVGLSISPAWGLLLLWPSLSTAGVALAYLTRSGGIYGKRPDGTLPWGRFLLFAPWLLPYRAGWWSMRWLRKENAYDELMDGVLVGRRLLDDEVPEGIETVVDLTTEFSEPPRLRSVPRYRAFPTLDGTAVSDADLSEIAKFIEGAQGTVYIHCAEGHGRAGMVAVLVLLMRGLSDDVQSGQKRAREVRPGIHLQLDQRTRLSKFWESAGLR